ncbi:hypothetical protein CBR_g22028 [Chara braunii]|uniref:DUF4283 domain-containing protein n=1 Tax=Chara braunii TaxID=69332 RepID=A0A388L1U0_CHABU|nr:hypothetical protein CBR_g22028 [Chara braunii]|eukprot:GBG76280.1 hypothetical protein CBR_g22028 [Chara braunii]
MVVDGREVRFRLNTSLDEIKVKWLKERTVTVIYKDAARLLPKKLKDDLVRAFEDGWVIGNESLGGILRSGRIKIEGPGVASYVAKAREVAKFMLAEGQLEVTLGGIPYKVIFKPWMTRAEFKELRRREEESTFWVIALQIPLDDMPFIYAQIKKAIGKIIRAHPTDVDPDRPALVNARFDIDLEARANMKDVIWVETSKGDELEIRLASAGTLKCSKCRQFFHSEQDCRRGVRERNQDTGAGGATSQSQHQHAGAASSQGWQMGPAPMDWLLANGVSSAPWAGWSGTQGGQGGLGPAGQAYQSMAAAMQGASEQGAVGLQQGGQGASSSRPFGGSLLGDGKVGGRGEQRSESTPGRARGRGAGKQRRLSMTSQQDLVSEPSGGSRISKEESETSVNNKGGLVTPGKKTTRGRRLTTTIKSASTDMLQYLVPLLCTFARGASWVIAWQRNAGPLLIFG